MSSCIVDEMFKLIVTPTFAFGAKRWISTLVKQYDRNACIYQQLHQFPEPKDDTGKPPTLPPQSYDISRSFYPQKYKGFELGHKD